MMDRIVPWWRRVLQFALSGFRSGFGLFARNGKDEAGAEAGAESELATNELENPEEDTELTHPSLKSEEVAAVVEQAAEVAATADARPAAEAAPCDEPIAEAVVEEAPVENNAAQADKAIAEASSPEETSLPAEQVSPSAPVAGTERVPAAEPAPIQEMTAKVIPLALPFVPQPAQEKTTAEKVAAALKARGQDAEQSPFSVVVSQVYDGPLDLLLDLIRKQDIDIYDIPIAKITAQFLAYVDQLKASDMDVAGEFIYTAALLIHIKSKMLLPRAPARPEDAA